MKRFAATWGAIVGVVLLVVFTVYDSRRFKEAQEVAENAKYLLSVDPSAIQKITILNRNGSPLVLEKMPSTVGRNAEGEAQREPEWLISSPFSDRADGRFVRDFIDSLQSEKSIETVAEGADINWATYGLDDPAKRLVVEFEGPSGDEKPKTANASGENEKPALKKIEIKIGSVQAYDSNLYAQIEGAAKVFLVNSSWDLHLTKLPKSFRDRHLIREELNAGNVTRIQFRRRNGDSPTEFVLRKEGEKWVPDIRDRQSADVSKTGLAPDRIFTFLEQLKGLNAQEFLEGESAENAQVALQKPSLELLIETTGESKGSIRISIAEAGAAGKEVKTTGAGQPQAASYVRTSSIAELLSIPQAALKSAQLLDKNVQDFFDVREPFRFSPSAVDVIEVETKTLRARFDKSSGEWKSDDESRQKDLDTAKLTQMLVKLAEWEADRITPRSVTGGNKDASKTVLGADRESLIFKKSDGSLVFRLDWSPIIDAQTDSHLAISSRSDYALEVGESKIKSLDLVGLFRSSLPGALPTETSLPSPQPAAGPGGGSGTSH
jgi:hypothetical protein